VFYTRYGYCQAVVPAGGIQIAFAIGFLNAIAKGTSQTFFQSMRRGYAKYYFAMLPAAALLG
jgi:hypothetical protein